MSKYQWSLWDNLNDFDLGKTEARKEVWCGSEALFFQGQHCFPVLLNKSLSLDSFLIQAEVVCTAESFVGLVFGAADSDNFELVYVSADNEWKLPNLQYDPVMNGSSTWQIYHGSRYQALVPVPLGEWVKLSLEVHSNSVSIFVGGNLQPQLIIPNIMLGNVLSGKIGVWGSSPSYIRNLSVEAIRPLTQLENAFDIKQQINETFVTEWMISKPYKRGDQPEHDPIWLKTSVEENGTLNLNRLYKSEAGAVVQVKCSFYLHEEKETLLCFGFSDRLRLWVNDQEVYDGEWKWCAPGNESDGRIRCDQSSVQIKWKAGINTICGEVTSLEGVFGWGLCVKTGLPKQFLMDANLPGYQLPVGTNDQNPHGMVH